MSLTWKVLKCTKAEILKLSFLGSGFPKQLPFRWLIRKAPLHWDFPSPFWISPLGQESRYWGDRLVVIFLFSFAESILVRICASQAPLGETEIDKLVEAGHLQGLQERDKKMRCVEGHILLTLSGTCCLESLAPWRLSLAFLPLLSSCQRGGEGVTILFTFSRVGKGFSAWIPESHCDSC